MLREYISNNTAVSIAYETNQDDRTDMSQMVQLFNSDTRKPGSAILRKITVYWSAKTRNKHLRYATISYIYVRPKADEQPA